MWSAKTEISFFSLALKLWKLEFISKSCSQQVLLGKKASRLTAKHSLGTIKHLIMASTFICFNNSMLSVWKNKVFNKKCFLSINYVPCLCEHVPHFSWSGLLLTYESDSSKWCVTIINVIVIVLLKCDLFIGLLRLFSPTDQLIRYWSYWLLKNSFLWSSHLHNVWSESSGGFTLWV